MARHENAGRRLLTAGCFLVAAFACSADWREEMWERPVALRPGVSMRAYALDAPRRMKAYVLTVDLKTPGIGFTATERVKGWGAKIPVPKNQQQREYFAETRLESTLDFMLRRRRSGANVEIAVNSTPWEPFPAPKGEARADPLGWCVADGVEVSPPDGGEWVLAIHRDGRAEIAPVETAKAAGDVTFAASGYDLLMTNSVPAGIEPIRPGSHPRMAFGVADAGRRLVILAVDGRQLGYSEGADFADLCNILRREGVTDAVNMDGGGSTTMVVWDRKNNAPWMLNRHGNGKVRANAVNFGITFADKIEDGDLRRTAGLYHSYEFDEVADTPPPPGYRPFYLSHYGRHGSRRLTGTTVADTLEVLENAEKGGNLTGTGKSLLAAMRRIAEAHDGMVGELSERGAREHRTLARRMAKRFPEVFKDSRRVRCRSSVYPRVLLSQSNFTMTLKGIAPALDFDFETGEKFQRLLNGLYFVRKDPKLRKKLRATVNDLAKRLVDPAPLAGRIFKSPAAVKSQLEFARGLFACASICQCLESELDALDIYGFFTKGEIAALSQTLEAENYCFILAAKEFGLQEFAGTRRLARDFVARADGAIADDRVAADLRFGHDTGLWPLAGLIGIEGPGERSAIADSWRVCPSWKWIPMASNIQLAFYRNGKGGDVLVKILWNEHEMRVRGLETDRWPYYRWGDLRQHILDECEKKSKD